MKESNPYEMSTDQSRFDVDQIHRFLASCSWAANIPRRVVEQSIKHSLCFGAFRGGEQVGFARAVTDYATFAYIADVFVAAGHRRRGVAKQLIRAMLDHPDLQGLRRIMLATEDAHGLYTRFGFKPLAHPEQYLTLHFPNVYRSDDKGPTQ